MENKLIEEDILFNPNKKVNVEETLALIEKTPLRADIFLIIMNSLKIKIMNILKQTQNKKLQSQMFTTIKKKLYLKRPVQK